MTIQMFKRKKGTMYRYRFTLKGITVCSEMYEDKKLCQRDEAKARAQILDGTFVAFEKKSIADIWMTYNEYKPAKPGTMKNRRTVFKKMEAFGLVDMPINKVTVMHIEKFIKHLKGQNLSAQTVKNNLGVVCGLFNWAYKKRIIATNPVAPIDMPKVPKKQIEIFSKEEFFYRLNIIKEKYYHLYGPAILACFFGLRIGEICAINIDTDIDLKRKILIVDKQYGYLGESKAHYGTTKSSDGVREVPIINFAMPYIEEVIKAMRRAKFTGFLREEDHIPFCCTEKGYRYSSTYLSKQWREMNKAEGWKHLTMHKLRHTYATLCRDAGIQMETISDLLGHADTKTTKAIYAHKTFVQLNTAAEKLDYLFTSKE